MNANNPQTPGVYTVEKNAFPNAVAQVPTAIPAFIGYTETAVKGGKPIINVPTMINSLAEYQQHFGGAPVNKYPIVEVDTTTNPANGQKVYPAYDFEIYDKYYKIETPSPGNLFYLYNSLQLFYQNGGGPCYIVSVGLYEVEEKPDANSDYENVANEPDKELILAGLNTLPKIQFPKPTMIVIPDALLLTEASDYFTVQQQALMQCGELEDRVALIDIYNGDQSLEDTNVISNFRNGIGNNYLNYGISYYPYLQTTIVDVSDITYANIDKTSTLPNAKTLSDIFIGLKALSSLDQITTDYESVLSGLGSTPKLDFSTGTPTVVTTPPTTLPSTGTAYPSWSIAFNAFPGTDDVEAILQWQLRVIYTMALEIYTLGQSPNTLGEPVVVIKNTDLISAVKNMSSPTGSMASLFQQLFAYDFFFQPTGVTALGVITSTTLTNLGFTAPDTTKLSNPYAAIVAAAGANNKPAIGEYFDLANPMIKLAFTTMSSMLNLIPQTAMAFLKQYNGSLETSNADYKSVMQAVANKAGILPPSAAMAGVYTLVDDTEGVWQSPANRNINSVIAPTVTIDNQQQAGLNVDALAGKSINAIRAFYGRGPAIVWGARTLDGNSQDWKYINVRRTMIMIEQSVANAAFSLVFQPNDASTWNLCESMIANFLHNLWSEGALQGASPAAAYEVAIGLGKTMTPEDVLAGIMRVQVKLALVRPAEFIIITYQQEMATS